MTIMITLSSVRKALEDKALQPIKDGIRGESIAIVHFEEIEQPFIHVQQEYWSKPQKLIEMGGKRPDFYLLPLNEQFVMVDVKYHSVGEELRFTLKDEEVEEYKQLIKYTVDTHKIERDRIQLKIFIIPKEHNGLSYYPLDFQDYLSEDNLHDVVLKYDNKSHKIRYADLNGKLIKIMTKNTLFSH